MIFHLVLLTVKKMTVSPRKGLQYTESISFPRKFQVQQNQKEKGQIRCCISTYHTNNKKASYILFIINYKTNPLVEQVSITQQKRATLLQQQVDFPKAKFMRKNKTLHPSCYLYREQ